MWSAAELKYSKVLLFAEMIGIIVVGEPVSTLSESGVTYSVGGESLLQMDW